MNTAADKDTAALLTILADETRGAAAAFTAGDLEAGSSMLKKAVHVRAMIAKIAAETAAETAAALAAPDFDSALAAFVVAAQEIADAADRSMVLSVAKGGRRYAKIMERGLGLHSAHRSVFCFVDKTNGDVLKAASWKAPAKHARGSIYKNNGRDAISAYGARYL